MFEINFENIKNIKHIKSILSENQTKAQIYELPDLRQFKLNILFFFSIF